jgi:hypothetical protein
MLYLDHLTIIAPSLAEGVEHVRACLDLDVPSGGTHPEMGTHNHVLRLGEDCYLEVIAVDPGAPPPAGPRWFGLGRPEAVRSDWANGARLKGWVARTDDIDAVLAAHGALLGGKTRISRGGLYSQFSLPPDGGLPLDGALPSVIDRARRNPPAARMQDYGARLREFVLDHPSPAEIMALYERLEIRNPPLVREGPKVRYAATIETARGVKTLT